MGGALLPTRIRAPTHSPNSSCEKLIVNERRVVGGLSYLKTLELVYGVAKKLLLINLHKGIGFHDWKDK
jgi:hypothetical protein